MLHVSSLVRRQQTLQTAYLVRLTYFCGYFTLGLVHLVRMTPV